MCLCLFWRLSTSHWRHLHDCYAYACVGLLHLRSEHLDKVFTASIILFCPASLAMLCFCLVSKDSAGNAAALPLHRCLFKCQLSGKLLFTTLSIALGKGCTQSKIFIAVILVRLWHLMIQATVGHSVQFAVCLCPSPVVCAQLAHHKQAEGWDTFHGPVTMTLCVHIVI